MASKRPRSRRAAPVVREGPAGVIGITYIESSAWIASMFEGDDRAFDMIEAAERPVASALTVAEIARTIVRGRAARRLTVEQEQKAFQRLRLFEHRAHLLPVDAEILARAGRPFPLEPIRTLDAVHLATLEAIGEPPPLVTIVTRDRRIRENALALGFRVA